LIALIELTQEGRATLEAKTIRDKMTELLDDEEPAMKPSWVGYALRRLGLLPSKDRKTRVPGSGRVTYVIHHDEVLDIMQRYGIANDN